MGMSIDQAPNFDLNAILQGGPAFMERMKQFQDAKAASENALNDLHLGNGARAAMDLATRLKDETKATCDAQLAKMMADIADAKDKTEKWSAATEAAAQAKHDLAQAHLDEATKKVAAATAMHGDAAGKLNQAQTQADQVTSAASVQAAKVVSDAQAQAEAIMKKAQEMQGNANAMMAEAQSVKDKYQAALARLQALTNEVG